MQQDEKKIKFNRDQLLIELNWDTLHYIHPYADNLLRRLERDNKSFDKFWKITRISHSKDSKKSITILQSQQVKYHHHYDQYETSVGKLVIYQETLKKLHQALQKFISTMKKSPKAVGAISQVNEAFQKLMDFLRDSVQGYNCLHQNFLSGRSQFPASTKLPTKKLSTPYERFLLVDPQSGSTQPQTASFLETQYLINSFLGLCHAEIRAKTEVDLFYTSALEWSAFQRIHIQARMLENMLTDKFPKHELIALLRGFNHFFSDTRLHAYHSWNDEPIRRADHSLRYLIVFMKGSYDTRVRKLLEFDPLIRLEQREKETKLHQLHYDIISKIKKCSDFREKYASLRKKLDNTQLEHQQWYKIVLEQLLSVLNREKICSQTLLQVQSIIPPHLTNVKELAFYQSNNISEPSEVKFSMPSSKPAQLEVTPLPPTPIISLIDFTVKQVMHETWALDDGVTPIYKLYRACEEIESYYEQLTSAVSILQKQLAKICEPKNLTHGVTTLAQETRKMPRPNERAVRAIHLIAKASQKKPCPSSVLSVLQQITKITGDALKITSPSIRLSPSSSPENSLSVLKSLPILSTLPKEKTEDKKKSQSTSSLEVLILFLDWEALMYLSRDALLNLDKLSIHYLLHDDTLLQFGDMGVARLKAFEAYMCAVHLEYPSGAVPEFKKRKARELLRDTLTFEDNYSVIAKKSWEKTVREEIEVVHGVYRGGEEYFSWEELSHFNVSVRSLQEAYEKFSIGWSSIATMGSDRASHTYRPNPFIRESYYFTDWFNESKSAAGTQREFLSIIARQEEPMRQAYPYAGHPVCFTRNAAGLRRIHRDLYKFIAGLQNLNEHVTVITGNQAAAYLADYPQISVCLHRFRSMLTSGLREFRKAYALEYEEHQRLRLTYGALKKEYMQICNSETTISDHIQQGLKKGLDREKECGIALARIGLFTKSSRYSMVKNIIPNSKALMPISMIIPTVTLGTETKTVSLARSSLPFSSADPDISLPIMASLDWPALNDIHTALCKTDYGWHYSVLATFKSTSYWDFQGVFKERDRRVLVKLMEDFTGYFKEDVPHNAKQLELANLTLTQLVDRIAYSPNLVDFVDHQYTRTIRTRFLDCYDAETKTCLHDIRVKHQMLQERNAKLFKQIEALKLRITAKRSEVFSETRLRSHVKQATTTIMREPNLQESMLATVGFITKQARHQEIMRDKVEELDRISSEVSRVFGK